MFMKSIDARMKRYELSTKFYLTRRTPVILRIDGKAFHTFTRGMARPFDEILIRTMQETMKSLCDDVQGCVFGYTQSDEITLVLQDYKELGTEPWFDYRLDKVCSIAASKTTKYFNKHFIEVVKEVDPENKEVYERKFFEAEFDCRAFNIPKEEVCNNVIWRQHDAVKNSILNLAQSLFSHKEMYKVNTKELQNKMFEEKGVNWSDLSVVKQRGTACAKHFYEQLTQDRKTGEDVMVLRSEWRLDFDMPLLTQERTYVEDLIYFEDETNESE